jgi:ammonium transporter, Amt family
MNEAVFTANNIWMMVSTFLVFIMHLGFGTLESGLTRSKNSVNILFKNTMVIVIGLMTYALWGFNLMYPGEIFEGGFFGFSGFGLFGPEGDAGLIGYAEGGYTYWTDFLFQGMFAATAATIVSGAVAERIKLESFLLFSLIYVGLAYPIVGMWHWGGGWIAELGFHDFAGSTIVHSVGGWAALAGVIVLGPRLHKYVDGKIKPIPGHNLPLAFIGVMILWLGWFGFNGGSVLSANPGEVSKVLVITSLAAAAGAIGAYLATRILVKTNDITMVLNGILAGLVGITASADVTSITSAMIIGLVAGVIVVISVLFFDRIKIDDPVGAISVHLVCGIWGTLATGIFGSGTSFLPQLIGILAVGAFCFPVALALFYGIKAMIGIRVDEKEEVEGLDIFEHGMHAYPDMNVAIEA